jgi:hypothetical protein
MHRVAVAGQAVASVVVEQSRDEMELQVATFVGRVTAADETAAFGDVGRAGTLASHQVLQRDCRVAETVVGNRLDAVLQRADVQMILQVRADARQILCDTNAVRAQMVGRTNAGQQQQLRRIDCAAAEDYLARLGAGQAAVMTIVDPGCAPAAHEHALPLQPV